MLKKRKRSEEPVDEAVRDKRERNCASSARFRQKKKSEIQDLENQANVMYHQIREQQLTIKRLETEKDYITKLLKTVYTPGAGGAAATALLNGALNAGILQRADFPNLAAGALPTPNFAAQGNQP